VEILDGVLGPGIVLAYTINAPREDPALPLDRRPDSASGKDHLLQCCACRMTKSFISASSSQSSNNGDYSRITERVPISADVPVRCAVIHLIEDTIVENNEFFLVQVEQIISSNDPVFGPNPEYSEIIITDNDGEFVM
jgi:hypothetical protein